MMLWISGEPHLDELITSSVEAMQEDLSRLAEIIAYMITLRRWFGSCPLKETTILHQE